MGNFFSLGKKKSSSFRLVHAQYWIELLQCRCTQVLPITVTTNLFKSYCEIQQQKLFFHFYCLLDAHALWADVTSNTQWSFPPIWLVKTKSHWFHTEYCNGQTLDTCARNRFGTEDCLKFHWSVCGNTENMRN